MSSDEIRKISHMVRVSNLSGDIVGVISMVNEMHSIFSDIKNSDGVRLAKKSVDKLEAVKQSLFRISDDINDGIAKSIDAYYEIEKEMKNVHSGIVEIEKNRKLI